MHSRSMNSASRADNDPSLVTPSTTLDLHHEVSLLLNLAATLLRFHFTSSLVETYHAALRYTIIFFIIILYFAANGFNVPLMSFARACLFVNHPRLQIFERRCSVLRMLVFIWCLCLLLRGYTGAGGSVGPPTCVGGREGGGGVRPFLFSSENSQSVAYSLPFFYFGSFT